MSTISSPDDTPETSPPYAPPQSLGDAAPQYTKLKIALQLLGGLWLFGGLTTLLFESYAIALGATTLERSHLLKLAGLGLVAATGYGLVTLREWARLSALVLTGAYTAVLLFWLFRMRSLSPDLFGIVFMALTGLVYTLIFMVLLRGKSVIAVRKSGPTRKRIIATLGAVLLAGFASFSLAFQGKPTPLESYPRSGAGELAFLEDQAKWVLTRVFITGSKNGGVETTSGESFSLVIEEEGDLLHLHNIPPLQKVAVRIDPTRNVFLINEWTFPGRPTRGSSPVAGDVSFEGMEFNNELGAVSGEALILLLEDGRLLFALDDFFLYGREFDGLWIGWPAHGSSSRDGREATYTE